MSEFINYIVKDLCNDVFKDDIKRYKSMSSDVIDSMIKKGEMNSFIWNRLSVYHPLEDSDFWNKYEKSIDWEGVCFCRLLTSEFIKKYKFKLGFNNILEHQDLTLFLTAEEEKRVNKSLYWKKLIFRNLFNEKYRTGRDWFIGYVVKNSEDLDFVSSRFYKIYSNPTYFNYSDSWFKVRVWYKNLLSPSTASEFEVIRLLGKNIHKR